MSRKKQPPNWLHLPPASTSTTPPRPQRDYTDVSALLARATPAQRRQALDNLRQHDASLHALILMMGERFGKLGLSVDHTTAKAMLHGTGLQLEAA